MEAPLNDGTTYPITVAQVDRYAALYPAVDVEAEVRAAVAWSESNPMKRKTRGGYLKHLNYWLADKQNKGGTNGQRQNGHRSQADTYRQLMDQAEAEAGAGAGRTFEG